MGAVGSTARRRSDVVLRRREGGSEVALGLSLLACPKEAALFQDIIDQSREDERDDGVECNALELVAPSKANNGAAGRDDDGAKEAVGKRQAERLLTTEGAASGKRDPWIPRALRPRLRSRLAGIERRRMWRSFNVWTIARADSPEVVDSHS